MTKTQATTFYKGQTVRYRPRGSRRWSNLAWYVRLDPRGWHVLEDIGGREFTVALARFDIEAVK